jgi:hypothetical protein
MRVVSSFWMVFVFETFELSSLYFSAPVSVWNCTVDIVYDCWQDIIILYSVKGSQTKGHVYRKQYCLLSGSMTKQYCVECIIAKDECQCDRSHVRALLKRLRNYTLICE